MARQDVERIAREAYAAVNRGDLDGFLAQIHADVEFTSLIAEAEGGVYRGHAGVRKWWEEISKPLGGLRIEAKSIGTVGDCLIAELVLIGKVSDVEVRQTMWHAARAHDGKAAWWTFGRSRAEVMEAAGLGE